MKKNEEELINIVCPACANTIVAKYKGEIVTGKPSSDEHRKRSR
jgi:hypothetical protein